MIVVVAKHGYIDKQYCYFVIESLELYRLNRSVSFRQRFIPELEIALARLAVRYSLVCAEHEESPEL